MLLTLEGVQRHLKSWRYISKYGEELHAAIRAASQIRNSALFQAQFELSQCVEYPAFESQPQAPSTRAPSLHNFELLTPPPTQPVFDENLVTNTPSLSVIPATRKSQGECVKQSKRACLTDITNIM